MQTPPLQTGHPDEFAVLGICIPPPPSRADEHEHGHQDCHEHALPADHPTASFPEQMMRAVNEAKVRSADFPISLDPTGKLDLRFSVDDRPTYVLVDSAGAVRRRFAGFRSAPVLQAMVDELRSTSSIITAAER